jgi:WD40 repeat protein
LGLDAVIDGTANFAAITPDERTLVWTVRQGQNLTVTYLDRADPDAAFQPPRSIATDAGDDQVAVSPDGLQLVYVSNDGQRLQVQTRADRTGEFAEVEPIDLGVLADALPSGSRYAEPVYGPEGVSFYFATLDSSDHRVRYLSIRPSLSDEFDRPSPLALPGADSDPVPRVTGVSADEQTLFLWDAATGQTLWAFLDASTLKYADPTSLAQLGPAQPNAACSRLYAGPASGSVVRLPLE